MHINFSSGRRGVARAELRPRQLLHFLPGPKNGPKMEPFWERGWARLGRPGQIHGFGPGVGPGYQDYGPARPGLLFIGWGSRGGEVTNHLWLYPVRREAGKFLVGGRSSLTSNILVKYFGQIVVEKRGVVINWAIYK